jgi:glyoxylase-like metal-dependent hydrolase (beta-lactamase superfamily II)
VTQTPDWKEPGAYPVADGVHRIPLPLPMDGLKAVNVYVMESEAGLTLVDGGWALEVSRAQLESSLKQLGHRVSDITRFLVTHAHRDHYTQAAAVRAEFGTAEVRVGVGERPVFDVFNSGTLDSDPTIARLESTGAHHIADEWGRWLRGSAPDFSVWAYPDAWIEDEQAFEVGSRTLSAIATPGHTQGHFVFTDAEAGLLFAGDHILPSITPSVGFELVFADNPLHDFLTSLVRVRGLPDMRLLPAHGAVTESSHARIDELLEHHDHRLQLCLDAVDGGATTPYAVAQELPWTRHNRAMADLDVFNSAMATLESMVHLDLLVARGLLAVDVDDGVRHYSRPGRAVS